MRIWLYVQVRTQRVCAYSCISDRDCDCDTVYVLCCTVLYVGGRLQRGRAAHLHEAASCRVGRPSRGKRAQRGPRSSSGGER